MRITTLLRPHWKALTLALLAVVGETFADVLQPWPIKVVIDNVVQSKKLPGWLDAFVAGVFAGDKYATLNFAVAAVAIIAVIGAVSGYMQKYLTTRVSQWVGHDLRRIVYQHIQRLSLAEHHESRSGDLIMRMTSDISAIQDFINSALLGILVNLLTLVGILGVMFYINWRFTLLALSIVPAYGGRLALAGQLSAGVLVVFLLYLGKLYKPIRDLSKMTDTVAKASVGYERIQEILEIESGIRNLPDARPARPFSGCIEFDRVSFGYHGEVPVLADVSFQIQPGQVAAIVGPSGTGKTTIAGLIARFYDPLSGAVRIDGTDIREYTLKSLRDQISIVLQDTLLFRGTIWENIAYGRPDASPEDTIEAARLANAHDFILSLPHGYATMVGERGATLSGGQRQRIAIARAIVRNAPILILDEPTAGLDAASEQAVIDALDRLMKGRTSVVIAHHLSTIRHADVIFVVNGAQVVEQGTHEELLERDGVYAELYRIQTRPGM